jgi:AraC-like DNA-binding protein
VPEVGVVGGNHNGDVLVVRHSSAAPLRRFVADAEGYRVPANPTGLHRGLPSRYITFVIELKAPLIVDGLTASVAAHGVVGGLHLRPVLIDATRPQEGLQYALTPLGVHALFGVSAAELHDHAIDLVDLWGRSAVELIDRLQSTTDWPDRFRLVDAALIRRLRTEPHPPRGEVAAAWRLIFGSNGRLGISEVANRVNWGRRHFSEQFRLATGVTPKQAARLARFESARQLLLAVHRPPLADVAARSGFTDQPHLAREWVAFAGCSIGTWLREELPYVQDSLDTATTESRL